MCSTARGVVLIGSIILFGIVAAIVIGQMEE